jgi:hypothetical protein
MSPGLTVLEERELDKQPIMEQEFLPEIEDE